MKVLNIILVDQSRNMHMFYKKTFKVEKKKFQLKKEVKNEKNSSCLQFCFCPLHPYISKSTNNFDFFYIPR